MANSVDPDQTAPIGAVCSGSTLFASTGFALGFIFLSPPFSPIRFFCAIFSNLEPDFGHLSPKKSQVWGHFSQKNFFCL